MRKSGFLNFNQMLKSVYCTRIWHLSIYNLFVTFILSIIHYINIIMDLADEIKVFQEASWGRSWICLGNLSLVITSGTCSWFLNWIVIEKWKTNEQTPKPLPPISKKPCRETKNVYPSAYEHNKANWLM